MIKPDCMLTAGERYQIGKHQDPSGYLKPRNQRGEYKPHFGPGDNAGRCFPKFNRQKNSQRCRQNGEPVYQHGHRRNQKGDGVIARSVIFQIFDFAFGFSFFETCGAQMVPIKLDIAQCT
jgi:hypothetical protein